MARTAIFYTENNLSTSLQRKTTKHSKLYTNKLNARKLSQQIMKTFQFFKQTKKWKTKYCGIQFKQTLYTSISNCTNNLLPILILQNKQKTFKQNIALFPIVISKINLRNIYETNCFCLYKKMLYKKDTNKTNFFSNVFNTNIFFFLFIKHPQSISPYC